MKVRLYVALCSVALATSACTTFEVEGDGELLPSSEHGSEVVHGSLYKTTPWKSRSIDKCPNGLGLYRVEYYTNGLFVLASALTLGVYVPQSVEWWCQAEVSDSDDTDELILEPSSDY